MVHLGKPIYFVQRVTYGQTSKGKPCPKFKLKAESTTDLQGAILAAS